MNLNDALQLIATFSNSSSNSFNHQAAQDAMVKKSATVISDTLRSETVIRGTNQVLPSELADYIDCICAESNLIFDSVGHPVELLKTTDLAFKPTLYAGLTGELGKWQNDWFLIAHEGGDPIIVKTSQQGESSPVYSAMQGMGFWDFAPIADSIGQFLVCISAIQYALNFPGLQQPLDEDFNLAPAAANWLFPFLRQHAGAHYDEWASVFENYI